jgi:dethiobiotin synthetase
MAKRIFITATDTDAGKTYVSCVVLQALRLHGHKVAVFKPISAGCNEITIAGKKHNVELVNEDAQLLQQYANCQQTLVDINPIRFKEPIAPHIAAKRLQQKIILDDIEQAYKKVCLLNSDIVLCEGAGGWRLPIGNGKFLSDFVKTTKQAVILVVNIKLGCLNHALLTYESIINDGLTCLAWVANCPEANSAMMDNSALAYINENIEELSTMLPIPLLATLPYQKDLTQAAQHVNLSTLL